MKNSKRWAIYIDVEGFSKIYSLNNVEAITILGKLMKDLYKIGRNIFPAQPESLFIHQVGDGFLVLPGYPDENLDRPISIAIALMQLTLLEGGVARASISAGEFSDILSCYPKEIRENIENGILKIRNGIMTIFQVMGEALINSYKIANTKRKGPCLFIDANLKNYLSNKEIIIQWQNQFIIEIDWIHSKPELLDKILEWIDLDRPSVKELENALHNYIKRYPDLPDQWIKNAHSLCSL